MGWPSSLRVGRGANNSSLLKCIRKLSLRPGLIFWYGINKEKLHEVWYLEC